MKPTAVVVIEGTLTDEADPALGEIGKWKPGIREKLAKLQETHYLLLVSAATKQFTVARAVQNLLIADGIPFDELYMGEGLPVGAVRYDNEALKL